LCLCTFGAMVEVYTVDKFEDSGLCRISLGIFLLEKFDTVLILDVLGLFFPSLIPCNAGVLYTLF